MATLVEPFVAAARERLAEALAKSDSARSGPAVLPAAPTALVEGTLRLQVARTLARVYTLELHVARLRGVLAGETPEQRFASFADWMLTGDRLASVLMEYAPAARLVARHVDQWVAANAELFTRLRADVALLEKRLHGGRPIGSLTSIILNAGDPHRDGRSVAILTFSSGCRAVYKPRSLCADAAFYDVLTSLNGRVACPPFRALTVLDRGPYGWTEFVEAEPCVDAGAVGRYYERLGGLLAMLYVLDGQDMHMENVIAAGEHPVLVDLESLFHPTGDAWATDDAGSDSPSLGGRQEPMAVVAHSVLKTGLLPSRVWADGESAGVDLSGLGGVGQQTVPSRTIAAEGSGTDAMRFTRVQAVLGAAQNQPGPVDAVGRGRALPALRAQAAAVDRGFSSVYEAIAHDPAYRGVLARALAGFRDATVRVIARPTQVYASLLREATHPDLLRDAVDRERFFDKLWLAVETRPRLAELIPLEQAALERGDIPVFTTRPDERGLTADTGDVLSNFFADSGFQRVARRVDTMGPADLSRQRWLVSASMATLADAAHDAVGAAPARTNAPAVADAPASGTAGGGAEAPDALLNAALDAAREVGDRLAALALRGPNVTGWLTLTTSDGRHSVAGLTKYDLYGGVPGILLFLEWLATACGTDAHVDVRRGAFALLREYLHDGTVLITDVGGFTGLGGIVHALGQLERLGGDAAAPRLARAAIDRVAGLASEARRCDVASGLAGAIGGLLSYDRAVGSPQALDAASRCAERLRALARSGDDSSPIWGAQAGAPSFAYGEAGIAWALLRLADVTANSAYRDLGLDGLARCLRGATTADAVAGDARAESARVAPTPAWCAGASGLALALLAAGDAGEDFRASLDGAVAQTLASTSGRRSDALANGTLGNVDVLLLVRGVITDPAIPASVDAQVRAVLARARLSGWRCGVPLDLETPGLMNGLAGIGYGLLRAARPDVVPSVLTLEGVARPPRAPTPWSNVATADDRSRFVS